MNLAVHLAEVEESMRELNELSPRTAHPASAQYQYIGTCIDNTVTLLTGVANAIDQGHRRILFTDENGWLSAMQAVHRSFFSSIVMVIEKACAEFCDRNSISVPSQRVIQAQKILDQLGSIDPKVERSIRGLAGNQRAFSDYINSILEKRLASSERRKIWRAYFIALNIIRNKASHSDPSLTSEEVSKLRAGGFEAFVSPSNELQINTRTYRQICNHALQFFDEASMD